jgi:hypothetical protein
MKTIEEAIEHIDKITAAFNRLDKSCEKAADAGCLDIEGELFSSIWNAFDTLVKLIDADGWVEWYLYENECGKNAMEAGHDNELKPITNSRELAELIINTRNR